MIAIPYFDTVSLVASESKVLAGLNTLRIHAATGTVTLKFNSYGPVPVRAGDVFEVPFPMMFERVEIICAAASTVTINYGFGSLGGGGGSGAGNLISGTSADPNASGVQPADVSALAFYLNTSTSAQWIWNPATQLWQ